MTQSLGSFTLDLSNFAAKAKGNMRALTAKVFLDIGEAIVASTPVGDPAHWKRPAPPGYVGGRARGSWQYGYGAPNLGDPHTIDASGGNSVARITAGVTANTEPGVHYMTSSVPYMRRLEYEAWSHQAPEGMVRRNILDWQSQVLGAAKGINP